MSARRLLATILLAILFVASVCGLSACGQRSGLGSDRHAPASPGTTWVVLVDLSLSTSSVRHEYVDALRRILTAVQPGDYLTIASIERSSIENSHFLYQGALPTSCSGRRRPPPATTRWFCRPSRPRSSSAARTSRLGSSALTAGTPNFSEFSASVTHTVLTYRSPATDIFGALQLAGNLFSASSGPCRLVMLTDGVVEDAQVNFRRDYPSDALIRSLARDQQLQHRLPDLHDAWSSSWEHGSAGTVELRPAQSRLVPLHRHLCRRLASRAASS